MKAVVFRGIGDIRLEDCPEPKIQSPTDAIVRITASAICGTDLHMVRGTISGMKPGTILGHEGVGVIEDVGKDVRNLKAGDRVVIPSTIACGYCSYCRAGYHAQCDNSNPNGRAAGTAFFGGPSDSGPFHGLQAEYARVPFANAGLVKLPETIDEDQAILLSDIFPTGYFGAMLAEVKDGDTVAVFGCGPVGQFAIASAKLLGAGRVLAIDCLKDRLDMARDQGAEVIDFDAEDPIAAIKRLTGDIGVDSVHAHRGPAKQQADKNAKQFREELQTVAPKTNPQGDNWHPGDAPSQAIEWAVQGLAKAGTLAVIGVYPESHRFFPLGMAMGKNLSLNMGNCNHRAIIPTLVDLVSSGVLDPAQVLTRTEPLTSAIDAYKAFDTRQPGWIKVMLEPGEALRKAA